MENQFLTQCSLFYCSIDDVQSTSLASIVESLQMYSDKESKQVYILDRILGNEKKTNYSASNVAVILIPKHQIIFLNYGNNSKKGLDDFKYEYIDDLMFLARNFDYSLILGRPRDWKNDIWFDVKDVSDFDIDNYVKTEIKKSEERAIDLLISLAIGSIIEINEPNEAERKRIETRLEEAKKQKKSEYEDLIISFLASNPNISRAKIESNALEIYNSFETDDEILKKLTDLSKLMGWI